MNRINQLFNSNKKDLLSIDTRIFTPSREIAELPESLNV